jgi:hypothetical protein
MINTLCSSEYCLSVGNAALAPVNNPDRRRHPLAVSQDVPCFCRLSYKSSPNRCGSCSRSKAGKLTLYPSFAAFSLRFCAMNTAPEDRLSDRFIPSGL